MRSTTVVLIWLSLLSIFPFLVNLPLSSHLPSVYKHGLILTFSKGKLSFLCHLLKAYSMSRGALHMFPTALPSQTCSPPVKSLLQLSPSIPQMMLGKSRFLPVSKLHRANWFFNRKWKHAIKTNKQTNMTWVYHLGILFSLHADHKITSLNRLDVKRCSLPIFTYWGLRRHWNSRVRLTSWRCRAAASEACMGSPGRLAGNCWAEDRREAPWVSLQWRHNPLCQQQDTSLTIRAVSRDPERLHLSSHRAVCGHALLLEESISSLRPGSQPSWPLVRPEQRDSQCR